MISVISWCSVGSVERWTTFSEHDRRAKRVNWRRNYEELRRTPDSNRRETRFELHVVDADSKWILFRFGRARTKRSGECRRESQHWPWAAQTTAQTTSTERWIQRVLQLSSAKPNSVNSLPLVDFALSIIRFEKHSFSRSERVASAGRASQMMKQGHLYLVWHLLLLVFLKMRSNFVLLGGCSTNCDRDPRYSAVRTRAHSRTFRLAAVFILKIL